MEAEFAPSPNFWSSMMRTYRAVMRWPDLRGEPKLAWWFLYQLAKGGNEKIVVTPSEVGAAIGTGDASGRRAMNSLAAAKLVTIETQYKGRWTLIVNDPIEVAKARRIAGDAQFELPFEDLERSAEGALEADRDGSAAAASRGVAIISIARPDAGADGSGGASATEVTPHPSRRDFRLQEDCARAKTLDLDFETRQLQRQLDRRRAEVNQGARRGGGDGSDATTAATIVGVLADRVAELALSGNPVARQRVVDDVRDYLIERVADRRLFDGFAARVARIIVDGEKFGLAELDRILSRLDQYRRDGVLRSRPSSYVTRAILTRLKELGIAW